MAGVWVIVILVLVAGGIYGAKNAIKFSNSSVFSGIPLTVRDELKSIAVKPFPL